MARGIYKALNIESGEESSVVLLIFQSVFLGIFYGTFDISAHTLFLEQFDQVMIPRAFLVSGCVGVIMTSVYAWLQSRMRFSLFSSLNLLMVALLTILMRFGFDLSGSKWMIFIVFVMMGPLNIVALLGFWGTVGRIFTLRQGKRLFGLIDTGQILGIIVSSYAIPLLLSFQVETMDLLYISSVSIAIALVFQVTISRRFVPGSTTGQTEQESRSGASLATMFRSRYIGYMSLFVVLLISVTIFVHFSFLGVARESYPNETDLAAFFGYFNGTLMVFSVLIKTFVYGRIMKTWGLKLALFISPVLILVFTVVAAVIGGVFGLAASFTMFFLIISVSKLFTKSLQDSIVAPSMKILYQSLHASIRYGVQARIDGTINEISVLLSSLLAAGLVSLAFFSLVDYSYVLILLLVVWALVALRLYRAYRQSLNSSLSEFMQSGTGKDKEALGSILKGDLSSASMPSVRNALGFIELTDFEGFRKALAGLLQSASEKIRRFSLKRIDQLGFLIPGTGLQEGIEQENKGGNRDIAGNLIKRLDQYRKKGLNIGDMVFMTKSPDPEVRLTAAMALPELKEFNHHAVLNTLLRDPDPLVRTAAIQAAAFWKVSETVPVLIDLLGSRYYRQVFDALVQIGEPAVESLEQSYYKSGIEQVALNRITRILGKIGSPEALKSLLGKINHQNREVDNLALQALLDLGYQADETVLPKILEAVRSTVYQIAWDLAAQFTILEHGLGESLEKAFGEELRISHNRLYNLLSLAYDPSSIHHIRQNLESGTSEGIGFAIELLDLFVAEEIKPVLFPVLEDNSTVEKIRQLQVEFPILIMEPDDLLPAIINRDPNLLGTFTRAAAIREITEHGGKESPDDLLAQVFNPDELLSELAALKLSRTDRPRYEDVMRRLPRDQRNRLARQVEDAGEGRGDLVWDRIQVLFRNEYLAGLPFAVLCRLAVVMKQGDLDPGREIELSGDGMKARIGLVRSGEVTLFLGEQELGNLIPCEIAGMLTLMDTEKHTIRLISAEGASLLLSERDQVTGLMFDHEELALVLYRWAGELESRWQVLNKEMVS
jgi:AAA family ATP:ADP antiporter